MDLFEVSLPGRLDALDREDLVEFVRVKLVEAFLSTSDASNRMFRIRDETLPNEYKRLLTKRQAEWVSFESEALDNRRVSDQERQELIVELLDLLKSLSVEEQRIFLQSVGLEPKQRSSGDWELHFTEPYTNEAIAVMNGDVVTGERIRQIVKEIRETLRVRHRDRERSRELGLPQ